MTNKEADIVDLLPKIAELKKCGSFYRTTSQFQVGGAFKNTRVFGGQSVAQAYIAATYYRNDCLPIRMDMTFFGAGAVNKHIDYHAEFNKPADSMYLQIDAKQGTKLLNRTSFRLEKKKRIKEGRFTPSAPEFPKNIPLECPVMQDAIKRIFIEDWILKFGSSYRLRNTSYDKQIFEMRLPDPYHYTGQTNEIQPLMKLKLADKMLVPLLISDYIVGLPSTIVLDQRRIPVKTMASMTHKVHFHSDDFDPFDDFLVVEHLENLQGMALLRGQIYTKNGLAILSYVQQSFFEIDNQLERAKL
ncbi:hypothetical protein M3Y97_00201400 [Aphelenchoides bicaudatus]|nr:hypothetical protein M3Y97_00201400 [Aphelenchoides bicaudatus]